jgi:phosphate transport system substrate-binding protein
VTRTMGILLFVGALVVGAIAIGSASFKENREINVISREAGSGTRGAFVELLGIEEKTPDGGRIDRTTIEAIIANKTDVVIASVASNPYAIGYISLGSLDQRVKALTIDGVEPTRENIVQGRYKVARPFSVAYRGSLSDVARDFLDFILSTEGQQIVAESYIPVSEGPFVSTKPAGKMVVAGSSSVSPLMEKLAEAYLALNPNAEVEIQTSDSTAGLMGAVEGTCDLGMASRELKAHEAEQLESAVIAQDGIVVIVNNENPLNELTSEQVKRIYTGELTTWDL